MQELNNLNQEFTWVLDYAVDHGASDIHIESGVSPMVRIDGNLRPVELPIYTDERANELILTFIGHTLYEQIVADRKELDFAFSYRNLRFRCNVFFTRGVLAASLRILPRQVPDLATLGLPAVAGRMIERNQGLVVVAGPTGHGKSTTLAAMVGKIAQERRCHIITLENPIEYLIEQGRSLVSQREVGNDTPSFGTALRSALREDPDVVMVGEVRDLETVEAMLQLAETGHLVLTSMHTNSAAQTADRIVSIFPPHQQNQVRQQLSEVLVGIISQRLLTRLHGGRVLATEVLLANSGIRAVIREGKTHQIPNMIQTAAAEGMVTMEKSLAGLVSRGEVSVDDALAWSIDPKSLKTQLY